MSALHELGENLREAAQRDIDAKRRRRRRRRRATGLIGLALIGGTAAAGAADLISVGEPATDERAGDPGYKSPPNTLRPTIVARADVGERLPFGLGLYKAANGQQCLIAGSLRGGYTLGRVEGTTFRPYPRDTPGSCVRPGGKLYDAVIYRDHTVLFGIVPPAYRGIEVTVDGKSQRAPLHAKRAFL